MAVPLSPTFDDWHFELVNLATGSFTNLDQSIHSISGWVGPGATRHRLESAHLEIIDGTVGAEAISWAGIQLLRIVPYADPTHELWGYITKDAHAYSKTGRRDSIKVTVLPVEYLLHSRVVYETDVAAIPPVAIATSAAPDNTGGDYAKTLLTACTVGRYPTNVLADTRDWGWGTLVVPANIHDGAVVDLALFGGFLDEAIDALAKTYLFDWELYVTVVGGALVFTFNTADTGGNDLTAGASRVIINDFGALVPTASRYIEREGMINALHGGSISTAVLDAPSIASWGRWESEAQTSVDEELTMILNKSGIKEGSVFGFQASAASEQCQWMDEFEVSDTVKRNNVRLGIADSNEIIRGIEFSFPNRVLETKIRWGNKEPGDKDKSRQGRWQPLPPVPPTLWSRHAGDAYLYPTSLGDDIRIKDAVGVDKMTIDGTTGRIDTQQGYQYQTAAPAGHYLRGDGTDYIDGQITVADITDLAYAVPALTFGAAFAAGAADSVLRTDAVVALGITCPDANTVYPLPAGPNRWTLTSAGATVTITGAVANQVNFEVVPGAGCLWVRDDLDSGAGVTSGLHTGVAAEPVLIGADSVDLTATPWVDYGAFGDTKLDVRGNIRLIRAVYSANYSLALWGMDGVAKVHILDGSAAVDGAGGTAALLDIFNADVRHMMFDSNIANASYIRGTLEIQDATLPGGLVTHSFDGVTGIASFNEQQLAGGDFIVASAAHVWSWGHDAGDDSEYHNAINYLWPAADGLVGQVLRTSGAGVLTWVANAASLEWTDTGAVLHPTAVRNVWANAAGTKWTLNTATGDIHTANVVGLTNAAMARRGYLVANDAGFYYGTDGAIPMQWYINYAYKMQLDTNSLNLFNATDLEICDGAPGDITASIDGATGDYWTANKYTLTASEYINQGGAGNIDIRANSSVYHTIGGTPVLVVNATHVRPSAAGMILGGPANRWTTIYGVAGNYSGDVTIANAAGIINTGRVNNHWVLASDGTRFRGRALIAADLGGHVHVNTFTGTASAGGINHNHVLQFTATNTTTNTDFTNRNIEDSLTQTYFYTAGDAAGTNAGWRTANLIDGDHTHDYDKTDTPTVNESGHTHIYQKTDTPTAGPS